MNNVTMIAKYVWGVGSVLLLIIGGMHLTGTLFTEGLYPTDRKLIDLMKMTALQIDDKAVFWKAWLGFNTNFSIGLLFMGFINLYLAIRQVKLIKSEPLIFVGNAFFLSCYIAVARVYLIQPVVTAFSLTLVCFLISYLLLAVKSQNSA